MTDSVNLDNLHEMTGGDVDLEKELFEVFLTSSDECFQKLSTTTGAGQEEEWRTNAHAWKGMSLNLGAEILGKLCAKAQLENLLPTDKKLELLAEIEAEFDRVKKYLKEN